MNTYELIRLGQEHPTMGNDCFMTLEKIRRAVKKFHRLCERYCNEADFNPQLIDKQEEKIKHLFSELPASDNINIVEIQHDPRGWEVKTNDYFINQFLYS